MNKSIFKNTLIIVILFSLIFFLTGCNQEQKTPEEKRQEENEKLKEKVSIEILDSKFATNENGYTNNYYKVKIKNNNEEPIQLEFTGIKLYDRANVCIINTWYIHYNIENHGYFWYDTGSNNPLIYLDSKAENTYIVSFIGLEEYKKEIEKTEFDYEISSINSYRGIIFEGLEIKDIELDDNGTINYVIKNNTEYAIKECIVSFEFYKNNKKVGEDFHKYDDSYTKESFYPGEEKIMKYKTDNKVYSETFEELPNDSAEFASISFAEIKNTEIKGNIVFAIKDNEKTNEYNKANNK